MLPPQAVSLISVSCVFSFVACVAVGLRQWARRLQGNRPDLSDYFIWFTLLNAVLNCIACIIGGAACGIGLPLEQLPEYMQVRFLKVLFAIQFFIIFAVWGVKVSVLLFYKRVFTTPGFILAVNITLGVLGAWIIAMFFTTLFQDKPIQRNWGTVGTTINWPVFYTLTIATDLALDLFILCMPLPIISRLHMSRRKKWFLVGILWLGAFIVISTIVRLVYEIRVLHQFDSEDSDFSFTTVTTVIWGAIEPCTSVVAACLPIFAPMIWKKGSTPDPTQHSSYLHERSLKWTGRPGRSAERNDSTEELGRTYLHEIHRSSTEPNLQEPSEIHVTRGFKVTEEIELG